MKKIILISSWLDGITERRQMIMSQSPYLKDYEIEHIFATQEPYGEIIPEVLYENLRSCIEDEEIELVLVHTGASFHQNSVVFIETLKRVKEDFPPARRRLYLRRT